MLATDGASTNIVYNALVQAGYDLTVIIEEHLPRTELIKRRIKNKRLGPRVVLGQILFMVFVERLLRQFSTARLAAIKQQFALNDTAITGQIYRVHSVNSDEARALLKQLNPDLVIISGTRIIAPATLECVTARFINLHAGITPTYRGSHGGYWALAEGHPELAGTTVHFVDQGIDTGKVIKQAVFQITAADNFVTYPMLQLGVGVPLLVQTIQELKQGKLILQDSISPLPSQVVSHPTLWEYLFTRITRGVK